jgi:hypothetical protein
MGRDGAEGQSLMLDQRLVGSVYRGKSQARRQRMHMKACTIASAQPPMRRRTLLAIPCPCVPGDRVAEVMVQRKGGLLAAHTASQPSSGRCSRIIMSFSAGPARRVLGTDEY